MEEGWLKDAERKRGCVISVVKDDKVIRHLVYIQTYRGKLSGFRKGHQLINYGKLNRLLGLLSYARITLTQAESKHSAFREESPHRKDHQTINQAQKTVHKIQGTPIRLFPGV